MRPRPLIRPSDAVTLLKEIRNNARPIAAAAQRAATGSHSGERTLEAGFWVSPAVPTSGFRVLN
jgi:hypothetical protein